MNITHKAVNGLTSIKHGFLSQAGMTKKKLQHLEQK